MKKTDKFALQVISRGTFVDSSTYKDSSYLVGTVTIRLNHVALNDYHSSNTMNCRECYEDGEAGDIEWRNHKAEYAERRKIWEKKITDALGLNPSKGSVCITQALSEVFTVVHITEIK